MTEKDALFELFEAHPILREKRKEAKKRRDPTCADDTLRYILNLCKENDFCNILEIGCAEGLTSISMLLSSKACLTAIEKDPQRRKEAEENFSSFGLLQRVRLLEGDAGEILPLLEKEFDLIFLDGPKVQYKNYFPHLKRLLKSGGVLLSDDVLLFGWTFGEPPQKRRMLAAHLREYVELIASDKDFETQILPLGEGLAVSKKH